jgi:uncharacterized protein (DUF1697 family)
MTTYISLLRGINVGGQKKVSMKDLKSVYESLGFINVATYIQSGNVVFQSQLKDELLICKKIQKQILELFGFNVPVMIRDLDKFKSIRSINPFKSLNELDSKNLYVTFLFELPESNNSELFNKSDFLPEVFHFNGTEIYLNCVNGYGKTKLDNNFFERKLKVKATTRNLRTINELIKIANGSTKP